MRLFVPIAAAAVIALAAPALAACPSSGNGGNGVQVESGYTGSSLTRGHGNWSESYLQAQARNGNNSSFYARFATDSRFGATDQSEEAGAYAALASNVIANIDAQTSAQHNFLPSFAGTADLDIRAQHGYGAQVGYTQRDYTGETVDLANVGADRYAGNDRFAAGFTLARLSTAPGTALSEHLSYSRSLACDVETFSVSNGRDVEMTGIGSGLAVYHAISYDINDVHWISRNLALDAGGGWYILNGAYNRLEFRFALRQRI